MHASPPAAPRPAQPTAEAEPTGWIGWVVFAGVAMIVLGAFQIIEGLVAVYQRGYYLVTSSQLPIINLAFIAAYPVWGILIIALDVVVIYALAVHGREMKYV